jgi:CheY-like chemotaxis protein
MSRVPLRRVLVVEDHADCRELLRLCGHEVRAVANGVAAVQAALGWRSLTWDCPCSTASMPTDG